MYEVNLPSNRPHWPSWKLITCVAILGCQEFTDHAQFQSSNEQQPNCLQSSRFYVLCSSTISETPLDGSG